MPDDSETCPQCGEHGASPRPKAPLPEGGDSRPAANPISYAGFWVRLSATFYDQLVLIIPSMIVGGIVGYFYILTTHQASGVETLGNIIGAIIGWLYAAFMESSAKQATLGKMLLKIKVTDLSGNPVSFGKASGRYFGKIVSLLTLCIGFFMAGWTEKKQGLHDKMAGCLVVNRQDTQGRTVWVVIALLATLLIPVLGITAAISIPAYLNITVRSQVSETLSDLQAHKPVLTAWYTSHGYWPDQGTDIPSIDPGKYAATIVLSQSGPSATTPDLMVTATFKSEGVAQGIAGKGVRLSTTDGGKTWTCGPGVFNGVNTEYLPTECR
ncbi:MAG: RDD family protein [Magnetococcales bacterium]|nr:RDD family protein [Magnetococcales bacterium]